MRGARTALVNQTTSNRGKSRFRDVELPCNVSLKAIQLLGDTPDRVGVPVLAGWLT
jgi:hypothetical protein